MILSVSPAEAAEELLRRRALRRDAVAWIQQHFWIPELNGPMHLAPYQQAVLREALTTGEDGLFRYSTIVWSDIKKSIKSCVAAALALWWADTRPWSSIKIVANDLKQADSREAYYARRAIELNASYFVGQREVKVKPSGYTIEFPRTNSRIEAIPIDPAGEAGGNDDLIIFTELWAAKHAAAQRMWTELTLSPTKYGKSLRWVETYAGFDGESPVLQNLYQQAVKDEQRLRWPEHPDLEVYANPTARLFAMWNTMPRLPWQTPEYYAQEAATLQPNEFARVHRNQWVSSVSSAIPAEWWAACEDPHPLAAGVPLVVAVDASVSGDCTALSVASRHPTLAGHTCERFTRIWTPPAGGKMDYDATLTAELVRMKEGGLNIVELAYDPYQLEHWARQIRAKLGLWCREFPQGAERLVADKGLVDAIRDRTLHHSGNLELAAHIANCNAKTETDQDSKLRLVKKANDRKIDGAVALSMARAECLRLNL